MYGGQLRLNYVVAFGHTLFSMSDPVRLSSLFPKTCSLILFSLTFIECEFGLSVFQGYGREMEIQHIKSSWGKS